MATSSDLIYFEINNANLANDSLHPSLKLWVVLLKRFRLIPEGAMLIDYRGHPNDVEG